MWWNAFHQEHVPPLHGLNIGAVKRHNTMPMNRMHLFRPSSCAVLAFISQPIIQEVIVPYIALFLFLVLFLGRCSSW